MNSYKVTPSFQYYGARASHLHDNYAMADKRLVSLRETLDRENRDELYDVDINMMPINGYAEHVPPAKLNIASLKWYTPHEYVPKWTIPSELSMRCNIARTFTQRCCLWWSINQQRVDWSVIRFGCVWSGSAVSFDIGAFCFDARQFVALNFSFAHH